MSMTPNTLYALIKEAKIDLSSLNLSVSAQESHEERPYFLISSTDKTKLKSQTPHSYRLEEHHLSVYQDQAKQEIKIPVLSCYHYTASYKGDNGKKLQIHLYFAKTGAILKLKLNKELKWCLAKNESGELLTLSQHETLAFIEVARAAYASSLSQLHQRWENYLTTLRDKIQESQKEVEASSRNLHQGLAQRQDYKEKLKRLIENHEEYIRFSPESTQERQIVKLLSSAYHHIQDQINVLTSKNQKKRKKGKSKKLDLSVESPSEAESSTSTKTVSLAKSKKQLNLELINAEISKILALKNNAEKISKLKDLYSQKLNALPATSETEIFETLHKISKLKTELHTVTVALAQTGDCNSFQWLKIFWPEMSYATKADFFFTLLKERHIELFRQAVLSCEDFNPYMQDFKGSVLLCPSGKLA